ncbi:hypothetical protein [Kordia jejudonensis]|uniref:hypothetical protein n=1 Tax=Kordia jejudonensis TaxID=1348245 RepID=UPI000629BFC4|nr:hypothetical protein [Kordia jejudonensis]
MLKNILQLDGTKKLDKNVQKEILGGRKAKECVSQANCTINQICQNGTCFDCYDPFTGYWYC